MKNLKKAVALALVCALGCFAPLTCFATDVSDIVENPWVWYLSSITEDIDGTPLYCPNCGYTTEYTDSFSSIQCPNCAEPLLTYDSDGNASLTVSGDSGNLKGYISPGVGRISKSGTQLLCIHPTFIRNYTGKVYVDGTQFSIISSNQYTDNYFYAVNNRNSLVINFTSVDGGTFHINCKILYSFVAPSSSSYIVRRFDSSEISFSPSGGSVGALSLTSVNLNAGDECNDFYLNFKGVSIDGISNNETFVYAPDLYLEYIPYNIETKSFDPYDVENSITVNNTTIESNDNRKIYYDTTNNIYYQYDDDVITVYNTDSTTNNIVSSTTYDSTNNVYNVTIYQNYVMPSVSPSPTPAPSGNVDYTDFLAEIKAAIVTGLADLSANFSLAIENLNLNIQNFFNKKIEDLPASSATPETATPLPTPESTPTATATATATATPSAEPTATPTAEPTATPEPTATATATPEPTATATPEPTATATPEPTVTATPTPTATATPTPTVKPSGGDDSGDDDSTTNPFSGLLDLLGGILSTIISLLWKLIGALLSFILWLLSLLGSLVPWLPSECVVALSAGVVIVLVIRIIKFIL